MKKIFAILLIVIALHTIETYHKQQKQIETLTQLNNELVVELENKSVLVASYEAQALTNYDYAEMIYNIEAELLEAIERHETGNFKSDVYLTNNNTFGANSNGEFYKYSSHGQSTLELARTLRFNYINKGLDTLEEIASVFCPNDQSHWVEDVTEIYKELKGR